MLLGATSRRPLRILRVPMLVAATVLMTIVILGLGAAVASARPNVVVIMTDEDVSPDPA